MKISSVPFARRIPLTFGLVLATGIAAQAQGISPTHLTSLVQATGCFAIGQQQAASMGGELSSADEAVQNGSPVCRIVVVIPASNGNRARRVEVIVPRN